MTTTCDNCGTSRSTVMEYRMRTRNAAMICCEMPAPADTPVVGNGRKLLATSHEGKYSYWQDADNYIYQHDDREGRWLGWLCSLSAWEKTFCKCDWMTLEVSR